MGCEDLARRFCGKERQGLSLMCTMCQIEKLYSVKFEPLFKLLTAASTCAKESNYFST